MNISILASVDARRFLGVMAAIMIALAMLLLSGVARASQVECSGVQIYPGNDPVKVAANNPAGTTYCINDGWYNMSSRIVAQDGDSFIGVHTDNTRPGLNTKTADHIIYTRGADNVTVKNLRVSGAVHSDECEPNCGRGIGGSGKKLTVENVRATQNENQGVGGTGPGLVIRNSELDHNGSPEAENGKVSAAGVKTVNSFSVYNSYIHDNSWDGVWCDIECDQMVVKGNRIVNNGKAGVHYEITENGPSLVAGNTIQNNGWRTDVARVGEVLVVGSSNIEVANNNFGGSSNRAVLVATDKRTSRTVTGVSIHDNQLNSAYLHGCNLSGVSCRRNN